MDTQTPLSSADLLRKIDHAIVYRLRRIDESFESIADEVISDLPHAKDFLNSFSQLCSSLTSLNMPQIWEHLPKTFFAGAGVAAAIPNLQTIYQERREHISELRATLALRELLVNGQGDPAQIDLKEGLELEGLPEPEACGTLSEAQLKDAYDIINLSPSQHLYNFLSVPSTWWSATKGSLSFAFRTVTDSTTNFLKSEKRQHIIKATMLGAQNIYRVQYSERSRIQRLSQIKTISEKIAEAQADEQDNIIIQGRYFALSMIDGALIQKLDRIREATRSKAQQLMLATRGVGLQCIFIKASAGMCVLHVAHGDLLEASLQYGSANLASNPLIFVGEQAEELYRAINSHRVEEADALTALLESSVGLPHDDIAEEPPQPS